MSNARFGFVPLEDIAADEQQAQLAAKEDVRASDLPVSYAVPSKLLQEGIRASHVLALHDGDTVTALARVLALDSAGSLHWRCLPVRDAPELAATPEPREVIGTEAQPFKLGIDAVSRDVPGSSVSTTTPASTTTASGARYWKVGPCRNGIAWPEWRQRGIAAIGWPGLYQLYAYLHRYDCQRAYLLYPRAAGVQTGDLRALARHVGDHFGTVGVCFVDLNRKLWTREGKMALADELAVIVREGLDLAAAAPMEATA